MYSIKGKIIFEDGHGNVFDESGNEAMDWDEEVDPHNLENLTNLTRYLNKQVQPEMDLDSPDFVEKMETIEKNLEEKKTKSNNKKNLYSDDQKTLFIYLHKIKLLNAAESARRAGVKVRTGQAWSARMKEDPNWNIYEKQTNQNKVGTGQLQEKHKAFLLDYFDEYPSARVKDAIDGLTENFENFSLKETVVGKYIREDCNLTIKKVTRHPHARNTDNTRKERHDWVKTWSKTDMDFNSNCVFIDESAFDINMRLPTARSARGTPVIITTPTTRAISHTILGAICPMGVVNMEIRVPLKSKRMKVAGSRKRKSPAAKKPATGGTNSGHYVRFINLTLDEMDKYPEMKGFYLVMDNSPIHDKKSGEIDKMIEDRGYKCVYLPKYSPELNPIEQFWASVKRKVKRSQFGNTEDLKTRISEACDAVPAQHMKNFIQHSVNVFEKCLNDIPI
jgi:hypothetical protein